MRTLTTTFAEPIVEAEDDPQEVAGDAFAELEWSPCPVDPLGHLRDLDGPDWSEGE